MNETEGSCQFLKSTLGKMQAARQVACFPFQPKPQEEKQVWHLLGCSSPDIYRTSWKQIMMHWSKEATKTRKLRGSSQGLFRTQHKVCTWKQSLVMKVNLLFVHFHTISYSPSSLYCWSQLSQGARLKFVVCEVPKESTFLPGCFWTAWNNTGSVAQ